MSNTPKPSLRQRARDAMSRLDELEGQFKQLLEGLNKVIGEINTRVDQALELEDAIITILGPEAVGKVVGENRKRKNEEEAAANAKAIEKLLEDKIITKTDTVTTTCIVVGHELDDKGEVLPPGRVQSLYEKVKPEFKDKILGQKVGFKFPTVDNKSFEVTEVYEFTANLAAPTEVAKTNE